MFNACRYICIYIFYPHSRTCSLTLERGEGREKARKRNIYVRQKHRSVACPVCPNWDQTPNPVVYADQESNRRHFSFAGWCSNQLSHTSQGTTCIYCKMLTTMSQVNILHLIVTIFFLVMRAFKIYSFSIFQISNRVSIIIEKYVYNHLYVTSSWLIYFVTGNWSLLT